MNFSNLYINGRRIAASSFQLNSGWQFNTFSQSVAAINYCYRIPTTRKEKERKTKKDCCFLTENVLFFFSLLLGSSTKEEREGNKYIDASTIRLGAVLFCNKKMNKLFLGRKEKKYIYRLYMRINVDR
jgi:hypothetical protein